MAPRYLESRHVFKAIGALHAHHLLSLHRPVQTGAPTTRSFEPQDSSVPSDRVAVSMGGRRSPDPAYYAPTLGFWTAPHRRRPAHEALRFADWAPPSLRARGLAVVYNYNGTSPSAAPRIRPPTRPRAGRLIEANPHPACGGTHHAEIVAINQRQKHQTVIPAHCTSCCGRSAAQVLGRRFQLHGAKRPRTQEKIPCPRKLIPSRLPATSCLVAPALATWRSISRRHPIWKWTFSLTMSGLPTLPRKSPSPRPAVGQAAVAKTAPRRSEPPHHPSMAPSVPAAASDAAHADGLSRPSPSRRTPVHIDAGHRFPLPVLFARHLKPVPARVPRHFPFPIQRS